MDVYLYERKVIMIKKYMAIMLAGLMLASTVVGCKKNSKPADNESVSTTMEDIKDTSAVDETEEDDTSEITEETTTDGVENETTTEDMEEETSATETEESTTVDETETTSESVTDETVYEGESVEATVAPTISVVRPTESPIENIPEKNTSVSTEQSTESADKVAIENEANLLAEGIVKNIVNNSMTDFQKTMEIVKWMMFNIKMETGRQSLDYYDVNSAIDTLKSKVATYTGYVSAFYLLANAAGVDTVYILAREGNTFNGLIWVQVKIDNKWYNMDLLRFGQYMNFDMDITYKIGKCFEYVLISDNTLNSEKYWSEYKKECPEGYSKRSIAEYFTHFNDKNTVYGESYEEVVAGIQKIATKGVKDVEVWLRKDDSETITVLNVKDPAKIVYGETYEEVVAGIQEMALKGVKDIEVWFTKENSGIDNIYEIKEPESFVCGRTYAEVIKGIRDIALKGVNKIFVYLINGSICKSYTFEDSENLVCGETCEEIAKEIQKKMLKDEENVEVMIINNSAEMIDYNKEISDKLAELGYVMRLSTSRYSIGEYYARISVKKPDIDVCNWYYINSEVEFIELCKSKYEQSAQTIVIKINIGEGDWWQEPMNKGYIKDFERYETSEYDIYVVSICE